MEDENVTATSDQGADVSVAGEGAGTLEGQEAVDNSTGQEVSEQTTETPGEGEGAERFDSPPADERIQQLTQKTRELEERLARQQQEQTQEQPTFANDQQILEVKRQLALASNRISELQEEVRLDPENSLDAAMEIADLQTRMGNAFRWMQEQHQAREQYEQKRQLTAEQQRHVELVNRQLNDAAELVRQDRGVTPEVWNKGRDWFLSERQAKPLLDAKYREVVERQGPVAAIEWAESYVKNNMGKQVQAATQAKEAGKSLVPGGKSGTEATIHSTEEARLRAMYPTMYK